MNKEERLYKIYLKWFKLGFDEHMIYIYHPNRWLGVSKAFDIACGYKATFVESFPWNRKWTWRGYRDGYNSVAPFSYGNTMPNDSNIRKIFNWYNRGKGC